MANVAEKAILLKIWQPMIYNVRLSHRRVNLRRPRPPHYERALFEALVKPKYPESLEKYLPLSRKCLKKEEDDIRAYKIDNPYENILAKNLAQKFNESRLIAICHRNMCKGEEVFNTDIKFKREGMSPSVYSRHTLELAVKNTKYEPILDLFTVHQSIIFSPEPKVDTLLKILKKTPHLILMAGIVDGYLASVSQLNDYSRLKDIDNARAELVSVLNIGAQNLVTNLNQQQSMLVNQLDQYVSIQQKDEPVDSESSKPEESQVPSSPSSET